MFWQLHRQFRDGRTEMVVQLELGDKDLYGAFRNFTEESKDSHPLPDGAIWMICNEESEYFVWADKSKEGKCICGGIKTIVYFPPDFGPLDSLGHGRFCPECGRAL